MTWSGAELTVGMLLTLLVLGLAVWKWRARRGRDRRTDRGAETTDLEVELTPNERLIASSSAVRAALITQFGLTWGSRTTEEIATDPALADRLGFDMAHAVIAYLDQVDRAKFAGEECDQADDWISRAHEFLSQFPPPPDRPKRPL